MFSKKPVAQFEEAGYLFSNFIKYFLFQDCL